MLSQPRNDRATSHDQPGLYGSEKLVTTKRNHISATLDDVTHDRLVDHAILSQISKLPRTGIFIQRQSGFARQGRELRTFRRTRETHDPIVRRVHAHDETRVRVDGPLVVLQVSSV